MTICISQVALIKEPTMARTANKTNTSKATDIVKSDYWLNNIPTPLGNINQNLVKGLKGSTGKTFEQFLALIDKHGLEKTNLWLKSKDSEMYIVQEGVSSSATDIDNLDDEFANL